MINNNDKKSEQKENENEKLFKKMKMKKIVVDCYLIFVFDY